jgi:ribonucleoside-diphosphate reductase alpha chain
MSDNARRALPDRRKSWTQKLRLGDQTVYLTVGEYEDGTPGEIFIVLAKAGSTLRCALDQWARMFSGLLQQGRPLAKLVDMHLHVQCEPCGDVQGHPDIVRARSVFDLVARVLGLAYLGRTELANAGPVVLAPLPVVAAPVPPVLSVSAPATTEDPTPAELEQMADEYRQWANSRKQSAVSNDGRVCVTCGSPDMIRAGSCYTCRACGSTSGCS